MEGGNEAGQKRAAQEIKQRIAIMQRGVAGVNKGTAVPSTLRDGKKIRKVTGAITGTGSVGGTGDEYSASVGLARKRRARVDLICNLEGLLTPTSGRRLFWWGMGNEVCSVDL